MPLKIQILEIVQGEKVVDAGAASQRVESTFHAWVQEPRPRRYRINLAKASADELNLWRQNVGGEILTDIGEMTQNGKLALYFVPHSDIEVLKTPEQLQRASASTTTPVIDVPKFEVKSDLTLDKPQKPVSAIPPIVDTKGENTRPPQLTR